MKNRKSGQMKDCAVSETIGFVLILGIVITGIGLVTLYGYPALMAQQAEANIRNMEKTMIVLQTDVNTMAFKSVPYQETTIQVAGGTLSVVSSDDGSELNNKFFRITNQTSTILPDTKIGQIKYQSENEPVIIGLQNGAVVKWQLDQSGGGSTMMSEPRWFFDSTSGTLVVPITSVYSTNALTNSGISTVRLILTEEKQDEYPFSPSETVHITYSDLYGDYNTAWKNYFNTFESTPNPTVDIPNVNKLVVKQYKITVLSL
ncbi:hypothetical protein J2741_001263 [Methanolinea mesophila]|uniref:DUF7289 family protein n=1 Tax=Methanolinea mesophila TaxID=547055 RepID=UPI001AE4AA19|nr:hypothetical protein [Methanolinea mesophila]MBP1928716.1 hypothetical protein [Methanolinea mesophila]